MAHPKGTFNAVVGLKAAFTPAYGALDMEQVLVESCTFSKLSFSVHLRHRKMSTISDAKLP